MPEWKSSSFARVYLGFLQTLKKIFTLSNERPLTIVGAPLMKRPGDRVEFTEYTTMRNPTISHVLSAFSCSAGISDQFAPCILS